MSVRLYFLVFRTPLFLFAFLDCFPPISGFSHSLDHERARARPLYYPVHRDTKRQGKQTACWVIFVVLCPFVLPSPLPFRFFPLASIVIIHAALVPHHLCEIDPTLTVLCIAWLDSGGKLVGFFFSFLPQSVTQPMLLFLLSFRA